MAPPNIVPRAASGGSCIAFFGGTFDPPHLGHLAVARAARAALDLDTVLFAPVGAQPLKPQGATAAFEDRLAMTRLAIAGEAGFEVSRIDAPRLSREPNYTIDTLDRLRSGFPPETVLFCLMGADSFFSLRHWHRAAEIPFAATLIVASRPSRPLSDLERALPAGITVADCEDGRRNGIELRTCQLSDAAGRRAPFHLLPGLDIAISASAVRAQFGGQAPTGQAPIEGAAPAATEVLPPAVRDYIVSHRLYAGA